MEDHRDRHIVARKTSRACVVPVGADSLALAKKECRIDLGPFSHSGMSNIQTSSTDRAAERTSGELLAMAPDSE